MDRVLARDTALDSRDPNALTHVLSPDQRCFVTAKAVTVHDIEKQPVPSVHMGDDGEEAFDFRFREVGELVRRLANDDMHSVSFSYVGRDLDAFTHFRDLVRQAISVSGLHVSSMKAALTSFIAVSLAVIALPIIAAEMGPRIKAAELLHERALPVTIEGKVHIFDRGTLIDQRPDGYTVRAMIDSDPDQFAITTTVQGLTGTWITTSAGNYEMFPDQLGNIVLRKLSASEDCVTETKVSSEDRIETNVNSGGKRRAVAPSGPYVFWVNQWYTPQVLSKLGSETAVHLKMQMAIDQTNTIFARAKLTQIQFRTKNVYLYTGGGESGYEIAALTKDLKDFAVAAEVNAKRDADHVHFSTLWHENGNSMTWRPIDYFSRDQGFQIVSEAGALAYHFVHEYVHSFGGDHDPANALQGFTGSGGAGVQDLAPYARGYLDEAGLFSCLMSYHTQTSCAWCETAPFISSADPALLYKGRPTGSPMNDNARVIRESLSKVFAYAQ